MSDVNAYILGKYTHRDHLGLHFSLTDDREVVFLEDVVAESGIVIEHGKYYWFDRKFESGRRVYSIHTGESDNKGHAWYLMYKTYEKGNYACGLIKEKTGGRILVEFAPACEVYINRTEIIKDFNYDTIKEGNIYRFTVSGDDADKNTKLNFTLHSAYDASRIGTMWRTIPDDMSELIIPSSLFDRLRRDPVNGPTLQDIVSPFTVGGLKRLINEKYIEQKKSERLLIHKNPVGVNIDVDLGFVNEEGALITAGLKKGYDRDCFVLSLIGTTSPTPYIEKFVYVENWKAVLDELEELALPEEWNYKDDTENKRQILESYLRFGFYKARLDNLIHTENGEAIFNTGLVDKSYDEIYCYLKKNDNANDPRRRKYAFGFFACPGKGHNGKKLNSLFSKFPSTPSYIDMDHLDDIYYDTTKEIMCDYEHFIVDNFKRLPDKFILHTLAFDDEVRKMIEDKVDRETLREKVTSNPEYVRLLQMGIENAVQNARKYCKWNYKTAIPIYYPRNNQISLLLPLALTAGSNAADIALVINKLENGNYQGQTILTLDMAYKDARQICRPNSEWLTLETIKEDESEDDDEASEIEIDETISQEE